MEILLDDIIKLFHQGFFKDYHTLLKGGYKEPYYIPPRGENPGEIRFVKDYIQSALHELAHWCLAGQKRRLKEDFGYWYVPDGRTLAQQTLFFQVEIKPQALEKIFSDSIGIHFDVSLDNLNGEKGNSELFKTKVQYQVSQYFNKGLPPRAKKFLSLLEGKIAI